MSRRERRQLVSEKKKLRKGIVKNKVSEFEETPFWGRVLLISILFLFIVGSLYSALKDSNIYESDLQSIHVTLKENPKYEDHGAKTSDMVIVLETKEYQKKFVVENTAYQVVNHNDLLSSVFKNDPVELKVRKSDLGNLNDESFFIGKYNIVFGLRKDGISFIDMDLMNELIVKDSKGAYFLTLLGLVMIPYIFMKREPWISLDIVIGIISAIVLIIFLIY